MEFCVLLMLVCCNSSGTPAAGATLQPIEFQRRTWTAGDGVGAVFDVQQDFDGYLWLTTSKGVFRFDGARFEDLDRVTNGAIHNDAVLSVLILRNGGAVFTTRAAGLIVWSNHEVKIVSPAEQAAARHDANMSFTGRHCISTALTGGMVEDTDGSFWVRSLAGLYHLNGSLCERIGPEQGYSGGMPAAVLVDSSGSVWVKSPSGLLSFRALGHNAFRDVGVVSGPGAGAAFLRQAPDGSLWLSDHEGLRRLSMKRDQVAKTRDPQSSNMSGDFMFTNDGSLWVSGSQGTIRFTRDVWQHRARLTLDEGLPVRESSPRGYSANWKLLADRERNVWIASSDGLEQLRPSVFKSFLLPNSPRRQLAIAAGSDASVWIADDTQPLRHIDARGNTVAYPNIRGVTCLRHDSQGRLWVAARGGVYQWTSPEAGFRAVKSPGGETAHIVSIATDRNNQVWATVQSGITYRLTRAGWIDQSDALAKIPGLIGEMANDRRGDLWLDFGYKLLHWDGRDFSAFVFGRGPLDISVVAMTAKGDHLWLAGQGGLVMFRAGSFYRMIFQDHNAVGRLSGVVETASGDLWLNGFSGVTHVPAEQVQQWIRKPQTIVSADFFSDQDGLPGLSAERFPAPSLIETTDQRLWFVTTRGVAWLDPLSLGNLKNSLPPPVSITSITADDRRSLVAGNITLPKHTNSLEIDFTALSLSVPERVLFRYRLDGMDQQWREAGSRREAFYTNMQPGHYRFSVVACNNDGVWSPSGASLNIDIQPAFYQTFSFKVLLVIAIALLIVASLQHRIRVVSSQIQAIQGERLQERERIARDLHDTFFQSIQGLLLRFNTGTNKLDRSDPVRSILEQALEESDRVMGEGRELVFQLRRTSTNPDDLCDALALSGGELAKEARIGFKMIVSGTAKPLHSVVSEELLILGKEAIANAVMHAQPSVIEVEVIYERKRLRLRVRDDGIGIGQEILQVGFRTGHYGLLSMKERAEHLGGHLSIWSDHSAGTELEVNIPSALAYTKSKKVQRSALPRI